MLTSCIKLYFFGGRSEASRHLLLEHLINTTTICITKLLYMVLWGCNQTYALFRPHPLGFTSVLWGCNQTYALFRPHPLGFTSVLWGCNQTYALFRPHPLGFTSVLWEQLNFIYSFNHPLSLQHKCAGLNEFFGVSNIAWYEFLKCTSVILE